MRTLSWPCPRCSWPCLGCSWPGLVRAQNPPPLLTAHSNKNAKKVPAELVSENSVPEPSLAGLGRLGSALILPSPPFFSPLGGLGYMVLLLATVPFNLKALHSLQKMISKPGARSYSSFADLRLLLKSSTLMALEPIHHSIPRQAALPPEDADDPC